MQACDGNSLGFAGADAFKFHFVACHALNRNVDETGFGWCLVAEMPEGGGYFGDQDVFDFEDG